MILPTSLFSKFFYVLNDARVEFPSSTSNNDSVCRTKLKTFHMRTFLLLTEIKIFENLVKKNFRNKKFEVFYVLINS